MDDKVLSALSGWLDEDQLGYINQMLSDEIDDQKIWEFVNRTLSKKEKTDILDRLSSRFPEIDENIDTSVRYLDRYPPTVDKDMEYNDYIHTLPEDDQEWIKQAYHEMYANGSYGIDPEDRIIQTSEMLKEARRHVNARVNDAYSICENTGQLQFLEDRYESGSMDESDRSWQELFKLRGYEPALNKIYDETEYELDNKLLANRIALTRFYIKMETLRKMNNRDMKTRRDRRTDEET